MPVIWNQGLQQQTPAVQAAYRGLMSARRTGSSKRRKKKAAAPKRKAKSKVKRGASKVAKFVKGSAAAKRHMAKLRKMVGKRR